MTTTGHSGRTGRVTPLRIGLALLILVLGASLLHNRFVSPAESGVPVELVGRWSTDDPRYAERALELSPEAVTFAISSNESTTYPIERIEKESENEPSLYTIRFRVGDQLQQLSILFDSRSSVVRLENQPHIVWERSGEAN